MNENYFMLGAGEGGGMVRVSEGSSYLEPTIQSLSASAFRLTSLVILFISYSINLFQANTLNYSIDHYRVVQCMIHL